jgi:hypothetical protein
VSNVSPSPSECGGSSSLGIENPVGRIAAGPVGGNRCGREYAVLQCPRYILGRVLGQNEVTPSLAMLVLALLNQVETVKSEPKGAGSFQNEREGCKAQARRCGQRGRAEMQRGWKYGG